MRTFITILVFGTVLLTGIVAVAGPQTVSYRDSAGRLWNRTIATDRRQEGTLLIVIDVPDAKTNVDRVAQRVAFRKFFGPGREGQLERTRRTYETLADRKDLKSDDSQLTIETDHPIWEVVRNQWTLEDELDYAKWFRENVTTEFLVGSGIQVDCADFAITVRWIYAHDHRLPVANGLGGSGRLFGHWSGSTAWDRLPTASSWRNDERFKAALRYLLDNAFTHTIIDDLYPVEISRDFVTPGSIDLVLYSSDTGHTQVINAIEEDPEHCSSKECLTVLWGNEPSREIAFKSQDWIVNGKPGSGGFMRWRWPKYVNGRWRLTPATQMPGYSLEQYSHQELSNYEFEQLVYDRLQVYRTPSERAILAGAKVVSAIAFRREVTANGHFYCSVQICEPGDENFEAYSTMSRDARLKSLQREFVQAAAAVPDGDEDFASYKEYLGRSPVVFGSSLTLRDLLWNTNEALDRIQSDPRVGFLERWGIADASSEEQILGLYEAWSTAWFNRDQLVSQGFRACYSPDDNYQTPICNHSDPAVLRLQTTRLDASLRTVRRQLRDLSTKAGQAAVDQVFEQAKREREWGATCDGETCTLYDYLFAERNFVEVMSPYPWATWNQRLGLDSSPNLR